MQMGLKLYETLKNAGIECLLDDRSERYGAKIADFELIGLPFGIIIGKGLEKGEIELIRRENLAKESLEIQDFDALISKILEVCQCDSF